MTFHFNAPSRHFLHRKKKRIGFSVSGKRPPSFSQSPSHESLAVDPPDSPVFFPQILASPRAHSCFRPHVSRHRWPVPSLRWPTHLRADARPPRPPASPPWGAWHAAARSVLLTRHFTVCVRPARANCELITAPGPPHPVACAWESPHCPRSGDSEARLPLPSPSPATPPPSTRVPRLPPHMLTSSWISDQDSCGSPAGRKARPPNRPPQLRD